MVAAEHPIQGYKLGRGNRGSKGQEVSVIYVHCRSRGGLSTRPPHVNKHQQIRRGRLDAELPEQRHDLSRWKVE